MLCATVCLLCNDAIVRPQSLSAKTRVTAVSDEGSTSDVHQEIKASQLLGDYDLGDGLGYNLSLSLKDGGKFECQWTGCLGVYGACSGTWSIRETGLKLLPDKANGMLKNRPMDGLRIVSFQQNYLLLQESDADWFKRNGPDTFCSFHQTSARKSLEDFQRRQREQAIKQVEQNGKH